MDAALRVRCEKSYRKRKTNKDVTMPNMFLVSPSDEIVITKKNVAKKDKLITTFEPSFTSLSQPSQLALNRTVALSKRALKVLIQDIEHVETWENIFTTPPESSYDVVLRLNAQWLRPMLNQQKKQKKSSKKSGKNTMSLRGSRLTVQETSRYANLSSTAAKKTTDDGEDVGKDGSGDLLVGFEPMTYYLQELKETFGHLCCFFIDTLHGNYIGVIYRRSIVERASSSKKISSKKKSKKKKKTMKSNGHPFTAAGSRFALPKVSEDGGRKTHVTYDRKAMVAEMTLMGGDLLNSVWEKE